MKSVREKHEWPDETERSSGSLVGRHTPGSAAVDRLHRPVGCGSPVNCRPQRNRDRKTDFRSLLRIILGHTPKINRRPSIWPYCAAMILLCEHPAARPVRKWKTVDVSSKARALSSARACLDARAPNQLDGLASADQGNPRAALGSLSDSNTSDPSNSFCTNLR